MPKITFKKTYSEDCRSSFEVQYEHEFDNSSSSSETLTASKNRAIFYAFSSVCGFILIMSVLTNGTLLYLLRKVDKIRVATKIIIVNMCIAALIIPTITDAYYITRLIFVFSKFKPGNESSSLHYLFNDLEGYMGYVNNTELYINATTLVYSPTIASLYFIVLLSLDRLITLHTPMHYRKIITCRRTFCACFFVWPFSYLSVYLYMGASDAMDSHKEVFRSLWLTYFFVIHALPIVMITVIYVLIFRVANSYLIKKRSSLNLGVKETKNHWFNINLVAAKTFLYVSFSLILTQLPLSIHVMVHTYSAAYRCLLVELDDNRYDSISTHGIITGSLTLLQGTGSFIQPMIHILRMKAFRAQLIKLRLFSHCRKDNKVHEMNNRSRTNSNLYVTR